MTISEVMDLQPVERGNAEILDELRALNAKMDRIGQVIDTVTHRVEGLEEMREDLWPMIHGASQAISRKLHELDRTGALGFAREAAKVGERVATSFSEEDVRLLGDNVVGILKTVRSLTQPGVMQLADRAATAVRGADEGTSRKMGFWRAMRDPEVRRGMTLMLSVLREMGSEGYAGNEVVLSTSSTTQE
jgi:uncharacterized protein YjgD (DUF1641 family)